MGAIELLKNANEYKIHTVEFTIPVNGSDGIQVLLSAPDAWSIRDEQNKIYKTRLAELKLEGLDKFPVDENEWQKDRADYLKAIANNPEDIQKALLAEFDKAKPETLAHYLANDSSRTRTIFELIPKMLKEADTGELFCKNTADIEYLKQIMKSNTRLITLITESWIKLSKLIKPDETGGTEKNSETPESGQSTDSR